VPPLYAVPTSRGEEAPVIAEPGDHKAAPAGGRLRASHADRDQAIEALKDAFAQGRLTGDELDSRVGQALASQTYAELTVLTDDLPADPPPRQPARAHNRAPGTHLVRNAAIGSGVGLIIAGALFPGAVLLGASDHDVDLALLIMAAFIVIVVVPSVMISAVATSLQQRRSRGQLPPRPGQAGQAPEVQRPGQVRHDPALPGTRPDHARAEVRTGRSRPGQPHPSGLVARAPRGIRPVLEAV
jgi:Domain of unknown function (DUF1707)